MTPSPSVPTPAPDAPACPNCGKPGQHVVIPDDGSRAHYRCTPAPDAGPTCVLCEKPMGDELSYVEDETVHRECFNASAVTPPCHYCSRWGPCPDCASRLASPVPSPSSPTTQREEARIGVDSRVVRHPNGHLMIERVPLPSPERIDALFKSVGKAWPILAQHASHMDGEFDNAVSDLRRLVANLLARLASDAGGRGEEERGIVAELAASDPETLDSYEEATCHYCRCGAKWVGGDDDNLGRRELQHADGCLWLRARRASRSLEGSHE